MAKIPAFDAIEFLVDRKFGMSVTFSGAPVMISAQRRARTDPQLADKISSYTTHLLSLPAEAIQSLVESERAQQQAENVARANREEQERFFNQPTSNADFEHWSKAAHWTLDEAIALSFGKAPEHVNWERVKPFVQGSSFAFQYQRRRDLAVRAVTWEQLYDPVLPSIFLAWAKRTELAVPPELEEAVTARGVQIADWKTLFDQQKSAFDENHSQWLAVAKQKNEQIDGLLRQIEELNARLASAPSESNPVPEKSLGARERESLLKLIIGMAIGGYGYDPTAARSEQPSQTTWRPTACHLMSTLAENG